MRAPLLGSNASTQYSRRASLLLARQLAGERATSTGTLCCSRTTGSQRGRDASSCGLSGFARGR